MKLKLDKNFKDFENKLKTLERKCPRQLSRFMKQQGELLVKDTKELTPKSPEIKKNNTPVDTGTLKGGWYRTNMIGDKFGQIVYNDVEYVNHVEFGHRTRLGTGKKGKPKPNGKGFVNGVYMLKKAVLIREKEFYKDLKLEFKKELKL